MSAGRVKAWAWQSPQERLRQSLPAPHWWQASSEQTLLQYLDLCVRYPGWRICARLNNGQLVYFSGRKALEAGR